MGRIILVTGGARSGKSSYAERRTLEFSGDPVYIATAEAFDDEMRERIDVHAQRRGPEWRLTEAPFDPGSALADSDGAGPRLLDCITVWLSNLLLADADTEAALEAFVSVLRGQSAPVILVTNEVGMGIVPGNKLSRQFRDLAGTANQRLASVADEVVLVASGLPLVLKAPPS